ncbi:alpha/beta fold hydrolase [Glaciibacter superstes]|uniref:alpha/beta fold hydrolase n=1 Tax=Glaciibacter superstes TaxID=501023 RepID=UPI0003B648E9|nr:alpha/beta fold hydrolase [Glaciibacter superstes]
MTTLLLHGLGADRRQPLDLFGPVLAGGATVIAPDVRGHGASGVTGDPADFDLDRLADDVTREALSRPDGAGDGHPFTVVGISMGAAIALRILLRGLLPIERAVFVRPAFTDEPLPQNLRAFPVIGQLLADLGAVAGEDAFRRTALFERTRVESRLGAAGLLSQFRSTDAAARAVRLVEIPRNRAFDFDAELAAVAGGAHPTRTMVVAAPRDPVHPEAVAERWADSLGADLLRVPARDDGAPAHASAMREAVDGWLDAH